MKTEMEVYPACCDDIISKVWRINKLREQIDFFQHELQEEFVALKLDDLELRALCKFVPDVKNELANLGVIDVVVIPETGTEAVSQRARYRKPVS